MDDCAGQIIKSNTQFKFLPSLLICDFLDKKDIEPHEIPKHIQVFGNK